MTFCTSKVPVTAPVASARVPVTGAVVGSTATGCAVAVPTRPIDRRSAEVRLTSAATIFLSIDMMNPSDDGYHVTSGTIRSIPPFARSFRIGLH
jgi:hypothetical protein